VAPTSPADALSIEPLGPSDLIEAFAFLDRDPVLNVYLVALLLRDALGQPRDEFWAARRSGNIVGLLHLGHSGAVLPLGEDPEALRRLGEQTRQRLAFIPRRFQIIGPAGVVREFLTGFDGCGLHPRLDREQVYMALEPRDLPPFARLPELRPATLEDARMVHDSGAQLRAEELEEDPRSIDAAAYRRRVEDECRDGHTYMWVDGEGLCFRASVSALTPDAAQISGVYTPPERRNRGLARRGLSELCVRLFQRSREVCLFVNRVNAPALAVYHALGFVARADWRSVFYDSLR
jgi:ribosomal protein S18 acetylase RimI-like enzyme